MRTRTLSGSIYKETDSKIDCRIKELGLKSRSEYVRYLLSLDLKKEVCNEW